MSLEKLKAMAMVSGFRLLDFGYYLYNPLTEEFELDPIFQTNYVAAFQRVR